MRPLVSFLSTVCALLAAWSPPRLWAITYYVSPTGSSPPYALGTLGGYWTSPSYTSFTPLYGSTYYGISTSPLKLAGIDGNNAALCTGSSSWSALPSLSTNVGSGAYGISADAVYVAGYSPLTNGVRRPVVWVNGGSPLDLAANIGATRAGTNFAVNANGVSVGQVQYTVGGSTVWRGFRTTGGPNALAITGDDLPPPESDASPTVAFSVNSASDAVGAHTPVNAERGAYWAARGGGAANLAADNLFVWEAPVPQGTADISARALGINGAKLIVGYSKPTTNTYRAVYRNGAGSSWRDLNDRHFVHGLTGWSLDEARGVNESSTIVGKGTYNGQSRGFLLTPRSVGN